MARSSTGLEMVCEMFDTISNINPLIPETWLGKVFLTLDIDWAHDKIIEDTVDLIEMADVPATFFVTHETPFLTRLRENPKFELGIHPNFNHLLNGDFEQVRRVEEIISELMEIVPEASAIRSHSLTQSTRLLENFKSAGLTHDASHFVPHHIGTALAPYELWNGLCHVPHFWEDDIQIIYGSKDRNRFGSLDDLPLDAPGLRVYDFHPIHIFLNSESLKRYEATRPIHQNPEELIHNRFDGLGTRSVLEKLLKMKDA